MTWVFLFMPSAVLGSAVTGRLDSLEGAFEAARTLLARWDRVGGYLRAWGEQGSTQHEGVTTIDALMNAAFVLWASMSMPSQEGRALALRHAENALRPVTRRWVQHSSRAVRSNGCVREGEHPSRTRLGFVLVARAILGHLRLRPGGSTVGAETLRGSRSGGRRILHRPPPGE